MGMAFTSSHQATLDEMFAEDPFHPFRPLCRSQPAEDGVRRGTPSFNFHCNYPDTSNAIMRRIDAFHQL